MITEPSGIEVAIQRAIKKRIEEIIEKHISDAKLALEQEIKRDIAGIAAAVCQRMSMQIYGGNELVIRVEFDSKKI